MQRKPLPYRIKAQLQKEINSECPLCGNTDVACFEFHHIDNNRTNDRPENILMLCPNCHSKYHKGYVTKAQIIRAKEESVKGKTAIEFVSVVENEKCAWKVSRENDYAFFKVNNSKKTVYPILNFSFINHLSKTIVLHKIVIDVKHLPKGISGPGPKPYILKPLIRYRLKITRGSGKCTFTLKNPIAIPESQAFAFETEIAEADKSNREVIYPLDGRIVTMWEFHFSNAHIVRIPTIYFNCLDDNPGFQIRTLG